ncbi:MAG: saccharopine dehydrogenase family protein [Ktedonobacterales bacterium]
MQLVVVGGGGAMGRISVRALAEDARVSSVIVADRDLSAAERTIAWLATGREKARAIACDARDPAALASVLGGADAVLNAADYPFNLGVMQAALAAGAHYADLGGLFHMTRRQYELDAAFRDAGLTAVLGIGSTPGITNLLARLAADQFDTLDSLAVRIGSGDYRPTGAPFVAPYSMRTILDECTLEPMVYRDGKWAAVAPMSGQEAIEFPAPIGRATAIYTLHSEVALFPVSFRDKGLRQASFKIAFPPAFFEQMRLLVGLGLGASDPIAVRTPGGTVAVAPRELLVALLAQRPVAAGSAEPTAEPDDCDVLRVVATGTRGGGTAELVEQMVVLPFAAWHVGAGDIDTGVPLAIAGILLAQDAAPRGVYGAELVFDPRAFLRELAPYGMRVTESATRAIL